MKVSVEINKKTPQIKVGTVLKDFFGLVHIICVNANEKYCVLRLEKGWLSYEYDSIDSLLEDFLDNNYEVINATELIIKGE